MSPNNTTTTTVAIDANETGAVGPDGAVVATNASNGSIVWTDSGLPVAVEQGPRWLVALAFDPPAWLGVAIGALLVVVLALVGLALYRNEGIPDDAKREMVQIGVVAAVAVVATTVLTSVPGLPYWADVLGGGFVAPGLAILAFSRRGDERPTSI